MPRRGGMRATNAAIGQELVRRNAGGDGEVPWISDRIAARQERRVRAMTGSERNLHLGEPDARPVGVPTVLWSQSLPWPHQDRMHLRRSSLASLRASSG